MPVRSAGTPGTPASRGRRWSVGGVVRCEAAGTCRTRHITTLADTVTLTLPRFASVPHKDPRARRTSPRSVALERLLRHRLGSAGVCYRALRAASGARNDRP